MNTSILASRDYLSGRIRTETLISPFKSRSRNPNPNFSNRRRRRSSGKIQSEKSNVFLMGQVRILKRGESLSGNRILRAKKNEQESVTDIILGSTDRLGPEPEAVKKQIGLYAGTAFLASPPPSSLPVPGFLGKGSIGNATSDLRRLLRLD